MALVVALQLGPCVKRRYETLEIKNKRYIPMCVSADNYRKDKRRLLPLEIYKTCLFYQLTPIDYILSLLDIYRYLHRRVADTRKTCKFGTRVC